MYQITSKHQNQCDREHFTGGKLPYCISIQDKTKFCSHDKEMIHFFRNTVKYEYVNNCKSEPKRIAHVPFDSRVFFMIRAIIMITRTFENYAWGNPKDVWEQVLRILSQYRQIVSVDMILIVCRLLSVLLITKIQEITGVCKTAYFQTTCDSFQDVTNERGVKEEWTHLQIGSFANDPKASVNLQRLPFAQMNNLRVVSVINYVNDTKTEYGSQCTYYGSQIEEYNYFGNYMPQLIPYTFPVLKLKRLNLINNAIETIKENAFFAHEIEQLDLSLNKLEIIQKGAFGEMPATKALVIRKNLLTNIDPDSLPPNLEKLDLDHNKLRYLHDSVLTNLPKLKELSLSHNRFATMPKVALLPSLIILDAATNDIGEIAENSFDNNSKLVYLDLSHNSLNAAPFLESFLRHKDEFSRISLAFNRLRTLNVESLNMTLSRQRIWLYGNPWDCPAWESIKTKFESIQDDCDKEFFSSGKTPYCLAWSQLFYVFQSDSERDVVRFLEEIKTNEKLVACNRKPVKAEIFHPVSFGCVA